MFIGHFGVALGAVKYARGTSLGLLFCAAQLADLVWPNLVLLGVEQFSIDPGNTVLTPLSFTHYPWSHSLLAVAVWAAILALLSRVLAGTAARAALVVAAVVLSHWILDALTHRADMPVAPGWDLRLGLGLWNHPVAAVVTELALFAAGMWLYVRHTRARDRRGSIGLWLLVGFLLAVYAANLFAPAPPSVAAVAWSAQAMWLLVAWAWWADRGRSREGSEPFLREAF